MKKEKDKSKSEELTSKQRISLEKYFVRMAQEMGLQGWRYTFIDERCGENAYAEIRGNPDGLREANVLFCQEWRTLDRDRRRHVIVHELFHCHLSMIDNHADTLEDSLGALVWHHWARAFAMSVEQAVDHMARTFGPLIDDSDFANLLPEEY